VKIREGAAGGRNRGKRSRVSPAKVHQIPQTKIKKTVEGSKSGLGHPEGPNPHDGRTGSFAWTLTPCSRKVVKKLGDSGIF